ncbi:Regulator of phospholipase D SRF1 [Pleurostoma richardsiae]|uniref:Regulator of phospholipase D SRF1 n=1 Tax=Pleurostoma richardsiae TaxID=41990 RepID=A0AA38VVG1_9PEZI|nr:Regulator of phospholipase D SRF1 [Pleurostoma richardsiae]
MATVVAPPADPDGPDQRSSVRTGGTGSTAVDNNVARNRAPRTLPPWIDSYEARYGTPTDDQLHLIGEPPRTVQPSHNNAPAPPKRRVSKDGFVDWSTESDDASKKGIPKLPLHKRRRGRGRKWDHLRTAEPVIVPGYVVPASESQWRTFVQSSRYGHLPDEEAEVVDPEILDKLQPGFNTPVDLPSHHAMDQKVLKPTRRSALSKRLWTLLLRHPLVPLTFRLIVLITSIVSLGISARIYDINNDVSGTGPEITQSIVAVVVDCVAVPYVFYMTWDEYTGRPLGLRPATQKISLTLMDLFFIIFKAVSTTLAFEALVYHNTGIEPTKALLKGLATFQLVGLVSWLLNLTVNVFRLVERLGGGEDDGAHV